MTFRCDTAEATFAPSFAPFEASWRLKNTGRSDETTLVRASAAVSIDAVKIGWHSEFDEKGIKSGGVTATVGVDVSKVGAGPLQVGVEASVTAGLEFDRAGLSTPIHKYTRVKSRLALARNASISLRVCIYESGY